MSLTAAVRIYVATGHTDLRRSIDGLSALVREQLHLDPVSGHLFLFRNRRGDRVKILAWDRAGFWILYKRLEHGTFAWPERTHVGPVELRGADLLLLVSGWVNRQQQAAIDYLLEENRVLRVVAGSRRLRLTDDQRRRLAVKGHVLGRRRLAAVAGSVTPDTILRWYRTLIAQKYDGSKKRRPGRPSATSDITALAVRMANENPTWGYTRASASDCLRLYPVPQRVYPNARGKDQGDAS